MILLLLLSCVNKNNIINPNLNTLIEQAEEAWINRNYTKSDSLGRRIYAIGEATKTEKLEAIGLVYMSAYEQAVSDSIASVKISGLKRALEYAQRANDDKMLVRIYNQLGVWQIMQQKMFYTPQYYFAQSISAASRLGDRELGIPAEMNLSEVFRITGDTIGFEHDLNLLEYATIKDNDAMKFLTGFHCALYKTSEVADTAELRQYIDAMRGSDEFNSASDMIYARFFLEHGRYREAEKFILNSDTSSYIDNKILYGEIERQLGRFELSNRALSEAITQLENGYPESMFNKIELHRLMSLNYHDMGIDSLAWKHRLELERQRHIADSLSEIDRLTRYKVEYDVMKFGYELQAERARADKLRLILLLGGIAVLIVAIMAVLYIRRRNRLFREIVSRSLEAQRLRESPAAINESKEENREDISPDSTRKEHKSSLTERKSDEIFNNISNLMTAEKIWKDKSLTRDSLAERLNCNRTYIWETIRQHTGMSFSQYVGACRINEAMRILSDTENDIELKRLADDLGFQSLSTFYSSFRRHTGMSPAQYRRTANDIIRQRTLTDEEESDEL